MITNTFMAVNIRITQHGYSYPNYEELTACGIIHGQNLYYPLACTATWTFSID